jgi:hypothetical protein
VPYRKSIILYLHFTLWCRLHFSSEVQARGSPCRGSHQTSAKTCKSCVAHGQRCKIALAAHGWWLHMGCGCTWVVAAHGWWHRQKLKSNGMWALLRAVPLYNAGFLHAQANTCDHDACRKRCSSISCSCRTRPTCTVRRRSRSSSRVCQACRRSRRSCTERALR